MNHSAKNYMANLILVLTFIFILLPVYATDPVNLFLYNCNKFGYDVWALMFKVISKSDKELMVMLGLSDLKTNFSKAWGDLNFPADFLAVSPFKSVCEGIIVIGSYAIAAAVLPFILNFFITPLTIVFSVLAFLAFAKGIYNLFLDSERLDLTSTKNPFMLAGALGGISFLLNYSGLVLPILLGALSLYRIYKSVPENSLSSFSLGKNAG